MSHRQRKNLVTVIFLGATLVLDFVEGFAVSVGEKNQAELPHVQRISFTSNDEDPPPQQRTVLLSLLWTGGIDSDGKMDAPLFQQAPAFSAVTQQLWSWKDHILGNGHDYFVPNTRNIDALQQYLTRGAGWCSAFSAFKITECAIVSNCARFELLVTYECQPLRFSVDQEPEKTESAGKAFDEETLAVVQRISELLYLQFSYFRSSRKSVFDFLRSHSHRSDLQSYDEIMNHRLGHSKLNDDGDEVEERTAMHELSGSWQVTTDLGAIVRHLCQVASGLCATRPRRPHRVTTFRPFASRDAHIMLQLKRLLQVCRNGQLAMPISSTILEYSIRSGKAARNIQIVPELALLQPYGTGDSKYCQVPPSTVTNHVVKVGRTAQDCESFQSFHSTCVLSVGSQ
jgi:hypothetical protein